MTNIFSRLKDVPGSFRFIAFVLLVGLQLANAKYLRLSQEQLDSITNGILLLITSDTFRQIGGNGGVNFSALLAAVLQALKGNGNGSNQPPAAA